MSTLKNLDVLVMNARQLNEDALLALYDNYLPHIFRFIYYQVDNRPAAENLTTETFLKMLMAIPDFTGDGKTFYPWLLRIASDTILSYLKSRSSQEIFLDEEIDELFIGNKHDLKPQDIATIDIAEIKKAVNKLPDEQKQVLILKFAMGLSNNEVTEVLGKSEASIKTLQISSLVALKKLLEKRDDSGERVEPFAARHEKKSAASGARGRGLRFRVKQVR